MAAEIGTLVTDDSLDLAIQALQSAFPQRWLVAVIEELALARGSAAASLSDGAPEGVWTSRDVLRRSTAAVASGDPLQAALILGRHGESLSVAATDLAGMPSLAPEARRARLSMLLGDRVARRAAFQVWRQAYRRGDRQVAADAMLVISTADAASSTSARGIAMFRRAEDLYLRSGNRARSYVARTRVWEEASTYPAFLDVACAPWLAGHETLRLDCEIAAMRSSWRGIERGHALRIAKRLQARRDLLEHPVLGPHYARTAAPVFEATGNLARAESTLRDAARRPGPSPTQRGALYLALAGLLRRSGRLGEAAALVESRLAEMLEGGSSALGLEAALTLLARGDEAGARRWLERLGGGGRGADSQAAALLLATLSNPELGEDRRSDSVAGANPALRAALSGRMARTRGDLEAAVAEFARSARLAAGEWADVADPAARLSLQFAWRGMFEEWASTLLRLGRPAAALEALDLRGSDTGLGSPGTAAHVIEHLAPGTAVLLLADVEGRGWAWRGTPEGWAVHALPRPLASMELQAEVMRHAAFNGSDEAWQLAADRLATATLGALAESGWLRTGESWVVVADQGAYGLPLDALPWPGGRHEVLLDHVSVGYAQTLAGLDATWHRGARDGEVVVFAPRVGPVAEGEIRAARAFTAEGVVLRGVAASEHSLRRHAPFASVLHIAAHATPVHGDWDAGGIQVRPGRNFDALLNWEDIQTLPIGGVHVVLLGCETAAGRRLEPGRIEPSSSLAGAFLNAGARSVISWRWPLREAEASEFASLYYTLGGPRRGLIAFSEAKRALRRAHPDTPRTWAGAVWHGRPDPIGG